MANLAHNQFMNSIKSLLTSGNYSDFTIACYDETFHVHKNIICPRSDYFANAVKFGKEATESKITLTDDDPQIIKLMLQYLYEADYDAPPVQKQPPNSAPPPTNPLTHPTSQSQVNETTTIQSDEDSWDFKPKKSKKAKKAAITAAHHSSLGTEAAYHSKRITTHANVYQIADKYHVQGLKELAIEKFAGACEYAWDEAEFAEAAYAAFTTTVEEDAGLRGVVIETVAAHVELMRKGEIKRLMMEFSGLAYGVLKVKAEENRWI